MSSSRSAKIIPIILISCLLFQLFINPVFSLRPPAGFSDNLLIEEEVASSEKNGSLTSLGDSNGHRDAIKDFLKEEMENVEKRIEEMFSLGIINEKLENMQRKGIKISLDEIKQAIEKPILDVNLKGRRVNSINIENIDGIDEAGIEMISLKLEINNEERIIYVFRANLDSKNEVSDGYLFENIRKFVLKNRKGVTSEKIYTTTLKAGKVPIIVKNFYDWMFFLVYKGHASKLQWAIFENMKDEEIKRLKNIIEPLLNIADKKDKDGVAIMERLRISEKITLDEYLFVKAIIDKGVIDRKIIEEGRSEGSLPVSADYKKAEEIIGEIQEKMSNTPLLLAKPLSLPRVVQPASLNISQPVLAAVAIALLAVPALASDGVNLISQWSMSFLNGQSILIKSLIFTFLLSSINIFVERYIQLTNLNNIVNPYRLQQYKFNFNFNNPAKFVDQAI